MGSVFSFSELQREAFISDFFLFFFFPVPADRDTNLAEVYFSWSILDIKLLYDNAVVVFLDLYQHWRNMEIQYIPAAHISDLIVKMEVWLSG